MCDLSKTSLAFLSLAICVVAYGADIEDNGFLIPSDKLPQDFNKLSAEAKADLLCSIAESSYKILVKVPEKGLRDSNDLLKQIISARKWLEDTNDVVARALAISMQYGVDSAVLNEMYRKEKQKHSRPLMHAFKNNSFDSTLVSNLLKQNEINEEQYIDFALGLDTKIGKFCRQNNYKGEDFLTGKILQESSEIMEVSLSVMKDGEKIELLKNADMRDANLLGTISWTGIKISSKKELELFLLSMVLNAIDEARDVRLLAQVYAKYDGFADKVEPDMRIVDSNSLTQRLRIALSSDKKRRLTNGTVTGKMANRVDAGMEGCYEKSLGLKFVPFMRHPEVFSEKRDGQAWKKRGFLGMWLSLSD